MAKTIFVAAADGEDRHGITKAFESYGYEVLIADNAQEAMKGIKACQSAVAIIVGSALPGGELLDICTEVSQFKFMAGVPFFILEQAKIENKQPYEEIGVDGVFEKPYSVYAILQSIMSALARKRPQRKEGFKLSHKNKMFLLGFVIITCFIIVWHFVGTALFSSTDY